jgi:hypothetical protein
LEDVDRDGRPDLATGSDVCCDPEPVFHWFRRGADGRFTAISEVLVRVVGIRDYEWDGMRRFRMKVRLADGDGDGRLDVLAVYTRSRGRIARTLGRWDAAAGAVEATAEVEGSPAVSEVSAQPVEVDWVSDGWLDLITADHALATPDGKVYTCRIWWQRNEGTPNFARLGPRRLLTSLQDWGPAVGLDAGDFDGTGRTGLFVAAKLTSQGRPHRAAVRYYRRRPVPFR